MIGLHKLHLQRNQSRVHLKKEIKANSPITNEQLQQHETTEVNHETFSSTGGTVSPVKTRSGRIIRKPVRYKDYI